MQREVRSKKMWEGSDSRKWWRVEVMWCDSHGAEALFLPIKSMAHQQTTEMKDIICFHSLLVPIRSN